VAAIGLREQSCGAAESGSDVQQVILGQDGGEVGEVGEVGGRCAAAQMELVDWGEVVDREMVGVFAGRLERIADARA
jgi:hypothetical protein